MTVILDHAGTRMHEMVSRLFPFCRSITGEGLRATLHEVQRVIPITLHEIPSGRPILDWVVPKEWNIRSARIESLSGDVVVNFADCNLHVLGYSAAINDVISREELEKHVYTLPDQPDLVPYRTAYWANDWGFCLTHRTWQNMRDHAYRVVIDSTLADGHLTYGELVLPGADVDEFLISVHCCHPSLANDNLSGITVATEIARILSQRRRRLTYRFLFIPATVGSLAWLAENESAAARVKHGLVLSCIGDAAPFHYKRSRRGDMPIDRAVGHVLRNMDGRHEVLEFSPFGYDERQYCSPGFDMPVGCLMRSQHGTFPEYHTSADNLEFVKPKSLEESLRVILAVINLLERNLTYARIDGRGEPNLGRRGLYRSVSGQGGHADTQMALLWLLNMADGSVDLLAVAERSGLAFEYVAAAAESACRAGLVRCLEAA